MTKQDRASRQTGIRRLRRRKHVRKRVSGSSARPRLSVFRSSKQIYVQAIDDFTGVTLAATSSVDKDVRSSLEGGKSDAARAVGQDIAKRLTDQGVKAVVFDRGWYKFHGRVKALADAAREAGLEF
ncbi:MAG: 50S ribosomal protein L18 [Planctomycetota bacterium]|nr:MAG: 50S ribosomal protein L18 [Planctomycetota bacterium]